MLKPKILITVAALSCLAVSGCESRRKQHEAKIVASTPERGPELYQRAEFEGRLKCGAYDPHKTYSASGRAKSQPDLPKEIPQKFLVQKNAEIDAAAKLLREAGEKCGLNSKIVERALPRDLMIYSSKVLSETPDGTINVTIDVMGKDILDLLGAVSRYQGGN